MSRLAGRAAVVAAIAAVAPVPAGAAQHAPVPRPVPWAAATGLLRACRVDAAEQTHARRVTLTLRGGARVIAREPRIDDLFRVLRTLPQTCRPRTVATE